MRLNSNHRAFTLVELLVVVAILALLLAILLPTISGARKMAQVVVCKSNLRQITTALRFYTSENRGMLPHSKGRDGSPQGQVTFYAIDYDDRSCNTAVLVEEELIDNPLMLYCPGAEVIGGYGSVDNGVSTRRYMMKNYKQLLADRWGGLRMDYVVGWESDLNPGPLRGSGPDYLYLYEKARKLWIADSHSPAWPRPYRVASHNRWEYLPYARTDGSADHLMNYTDDPEYRDRFNYYYPYNTRTDWSFWNYWGGKLAG
mgnify:CR=1 FL=1